MNKSLFINVCRCAEMIKPDPIIEIPYKLGSKEGRAYLAGYKQAIEDMKRKLIRAT